MREIRLHGRGGQGVVMAAQIMTAAFFAEGKYAASFPMFGFERRGAPVVAYARVDDVPIREKTQIYNPDCLVVLEQTLQGLPMVFDGLRPDGILVLNSAKLPKKKLHENLKTIGVVNATTIAQEEVGIPATNTCILGAFVKATEWINLGSLLSALGEYFKGDLLKKNMRSAERGYEETVVQSLS